ncbi:MAG: ATP-binding cassette domain-containing protein [Actinobacteria bacterium]|nr:ATP-binding cassette domain-containing protein [Actinomycetota bacterium]
MADKTTPPDPGARPATTGSLAGVAPTPGVAKPDPVLIIDGVRRTFGGLTAVDVEHLEIQRGLITALIGPNGAGKTTLFNLLTGFDEPDEGSWRFDSQELANKPAHKVARGGMVRTFQLTKSLSKLPVIENMKLGATEQRGENFLTAHLPWTWRKQEDGIEERADTLLARFKLDHMRNEFAGTLSGGQRKLLEMARALMVAPDVVMLDEPMAGVNPALTQSLLQHVKGLRDEGMTVIFVEHDMDVVMDISDWVVVMAEGKIIAEGPPAAIAQNRDVVDAYLGAHHDEELTDQEEADRASVAEVRERDQVDRIKRDEGFLLEARDVVAGYVPGVNILNGCDLELREGEFVGIIGPNGAGKSTLLKSLFGLIDIREGTITLEGEDITGLKAHSLVAKGVGYVPQVANVFPDLTVQENLEMGLYLGGHDFEERMDYVTGLFPLLGQRRKQQAGSLSGGERQMVAMGRALMMDPKVLLLDEPSAGLSPAYQDEVFVRCREINATGVSIVMVEQNARRCLQVCHRGYVLDQGTNAYEGRGRDLLNDPKVIELYLGTLAQAE